jgi:uncharacterized protein YbbK (DUF523 family)
MGVPREPVRLLGKTDDPSMIAERSGKDWTAAMKRSSALDLFNFCVQLGN